MEHFLLVSCLLEETTNAKEMNILTENGSQVEDYGLDVQLMPYVTKLRTMLLPPHQTFAAQSQHPSSDCP